LCEYGDDDYIDRLTTKTQRDSIRIIKQLQSGRDENLSDAAEQHNVMDDRFQRENAKQTERMRRVTEAVHITKKKE